MGIFECSFFIYCQWFYITLISFIYLLLILVVTIFP